MSGAIDTDLITHVIVDPGEHFSVVVSVFYSCRCHASGYFCSMRSTLSTSLLSVGCDSGSIGISEAVLKTRPNVTTGVRVAALLAGQY